MICFSIKLKTEWFDIFFQNAVQESSMLRISCYTECVGLVNLVDSLDHIYDKTPKLLEQ